MTTRRLFLLFSLSILCSCLKSQETFFTHIRDADNAKISLIADWDVLPTIKGDSAIEGHIVLTIGDSTESWEAEFAPRGRFRRTRCAFPPFEINLRKKELRRQEMQEFDKLKVVTHCNDKDGVSEDIYEELLLYNMYRTLTPNSFEAIPLFVDYMLPDGKAYMTDALILILEPTDELSWRTDGQELEGFGISPDSLDPISYCRVAMFQFMIGNTDWSQMMQRNVKMIGTPARYHLIPYDFDFSAIVFPPYALLTKDHGQKDFRDRVYLGEYFQDRIPEMQEEFLVKKELLYSCVQNETNLSKGRRKEIQKYLDIFFACISNRNNNIAPGLILPYNPD